MLEPVGSSRKCRWLIGWLVGHFELKLGLLGASEMMGFKDEDGDGDDDDGDGQTCTKNATDRQTDAVLA